jgi:zinc protease
VGRFEPASTLAYVRSLFEVIPRGAPTPAPSSGGAAPAAHERRAWTRGDTPLRLAFAGWRGPGSADPDAPALEVMAEVLGAEGSRLEQSLKSEWKVAVATQSGLQMHRDVSLLWVAAALAADADSSTAERAMLDEVGRLAREPVAEAQFARVRSRLVLDALFGTQTVRARAAGLGEALFEHGDPALAARRLESLERLTPADVQRAAQRVLAEADRSVSWYVPAGEGR